ncbi:MAG: diacylglycerol/lipid kinase family protein [Lachnospiraceae bacterium]
MLYFIVNRTSGMGKSEAVWQKAKKCLKDSVIEYKAYDTKYVGHATKIAAKLCELPEEKVSIVVVGGDGTVNEVLNGITDFRKVRLGIIPAGSGNDFAKGMHIKKDVVANVTQIALHDKTDNITLMDLGMVIYDGCTRPKVFGISSGLGLDAIVCKKAYRSKLKRMLNKIHLGKLTYVLTTIYSLFSMETTDLKMDMERKVPNENQSFRVETHMNKVIFLAAMNLRAEGGGVPMAPNASGTNGCLAMSSASGIPKWKTFFCLPFLIFAKQEWIKGFDMHYTDKATIVLSKPMTLHVDGEYCGEVRKVTYECLPGFLNLLN